MESKKIQKITIMPWERSEYPDYKSISELHKMRLKPHPNAKPRAQVKRRLYGRDQSYDVYDVNVTVPCVSTKKEREHARKLASTRKDRLSCPKCGRYLGKDYGWMMRVFDGRCVECHEEHTAWQWLALFRRIPKPNTEAHLRKYRMNYDYQDHEDATSVSWYYYYFDETMPIDDQRYEELKALYISLYGGWDMIDLKHTEYDGRIWWDNEKS